jgi:hypothetical protein
VRAPDFGCCWMMMPKVFDATGDKAISPSELGAGLARVGVECSESQLEVCEKEAGSHPPPHHAPVLIPPE